MNEVDRIQKELDKYDISVREIDESVKSIRITICGDWKHSHLATDWVMKNLGYVRDDEIITEDNESDWYTSMHYYSKPNK